MKTLEGLVGAYLAESHTTKKSLADYIGCTPETLNSKLAGRSDLTIRDARKLAAAMNRTVEEICAVAP